MDIVTLALAKKFTKDTANQFGAVKGANCKVIGTEIQETKTKVTFQWKNDADEVKTSDVFIPNGAEGVSVKSVSVDSDNHIIVTLSDGSVIDAGELDTLDRLSASLTATVSIGTVTAGKTYPKGTALETIIRDMLIKVEAPGITLSLDPSATVYDVVLDEIETITLKANITKKTYEVKKLEFYMGDVLLESRDVPATGVNSFIFTPDSPIKSTCTFKAVVTDSENNKNSASVTVSFVGSSYYGFVEPSVGAPSESDIKALNKKLKTVKGFVYENATYSYNKMVYAYPASFGALASIKDLENNINYTNSFTKTSVVVDGIDYFVYTQNNASKAAGINITFA